MTELAVREDTTTQLTVIHQTASDLSDAHRIGSVIAATSFAPAHFRSKPEECAIAILYGQTIGLDPMTAVQQIYVIGGKPALYARAMVAIVLSHGHQIWTEEETDGAVTVAGQRKGSARVERITWTSSMAQRAGYASNKKYQTDPRSMLYARASGDIARRVAPDALLGMAYTVEEMQLEPELGPATVITAAAFTPAAALEAEDTPAEQAEPAGVPTEMITAAQLRKIGAAMKDLAITGRAEALAYVSAAAGRDITSRNDLTKAEASAVVDALEADLAALPVAEIDDEPVNTTTGEVYDDAAAADAAWLASQAAAS